MGSLLIQLDVDRSDWQTLLGQVSQLKPEQLYIKLHGSRVDGGVHDSTVELLGQLYDVLCTPNPRVCAVPLLEHAGWSLERIASLQPLDAVVSPSGAEQRAAADALAQTLSTLRPAHLPPIATLELSPTPWDGKAAATSTPCDGGTAALTSSAPEDTIATRTSSSSTPPPHSSQRHATATPSPGTTAAAAAAPGTGPATPSEASTSIDGIVKHGEDEEAEDKALSFAHVAVGGTFDRLHVGHMLLLAATALVARDTAYIGITADLLLANKRNRDVMQSYDERHDAAVRFVKLVRPALGVHTGALSDPKAPTQAELDPAMQALVVSHETLAGGEAINAGRSARGFAPLALVVVPVLASASEPGSKVSSTALREIDAAARAAAR